MFEQPTHLYLNPVAAESTEAFEAFLTERVLPAMRAERPDQEGRWHVLRSVSTEGAQGSTRVYAFVFDGGSLDDWDLDELLPAHYGDDEAKRLLDDWMGTFVPLHQWLASLDGEEGSPQVGWTFERVG